jgi:hypothetical protein
MIPQMQRAGIEFNFHTEAHTPSTQTLHKPHTDAHTHIPPHIKQDVRALKHPNFLKYDVIKQKPS